MPPFPRLPLLGATLILAACSTSSANLDQPDAARAEPAPDAAVDATVHDAAVLDAAIPDAGEDVTALGGGDAALPFDDAECMPSLLDGWAPSLDCQAMPTGSCPACLSFPYVCGEQAGAFPVALAEAGAPISVLSVLKTLWLCSDVAACVASKGSDGLCPDASPNAYSCAVYADGGMAVAPKVGCVAAPAGSELTGGVCCP
ncbi:MAG: hypothetical protein ACLQVI_19245 [Polyangiaceae bacterium]|jgi:hypothetical protein